jgi:hypothetical protein
VETNSTREISSYRHPKDIHHLTLSVFISLLLLIPLSVSIFDLHGTEDVYAQQEETSTGATSNPPAASTLASTRATPVLPQSLQITDIALGDTQLPLRASIINNESVGELSDAGQDRGQLGEYFPIVVFHFDKRPVGFEEGSTIVKHVLIGPIKSYDSIDGVLEEANYWKDIPLDKKVALETDHPGLHYFIASVQFANGTSGIYSGLMEIEVIGIKPSSDDSIQFQLGPENSAAGVVKIDQSDIKTVESDPSFQQIASRIICSDLSENGFEVCEDGNENEVLEDDNNEAENSDNADSDDNGNDDNVEDDDNANDEDEEEVRGDGGRGGRYDTNNCTGEQCEDADRETEEERNSDDCEINSDLCKGGDSDEDEDNEDEDNDQNNENEENN